MRFAYEITGNITFMDRLERLAFNALPAALWPDVTANVYHHRSNQINCGGQYGYNLFCTSYEQHQDHNMPQPPPPPPPPPLSC